MLLTMLLLLQLKAAQMNGSIWSEVSSAFSTAPTYVLYRACHGIAIAIATVNPTISHEQQCHYDGLVII